MMCWYCLCALLELGLIIENDDANARCHRCNAQRDQARSGETVAYKAATEVLWTELQKTRKGLDFSDRQNDNLRSDLLDRYEKGGRK